MKDTDFVGALTPVVTALIDATIDQRMRGTAEGLAFMIARAYTPQLDLLELRLNSIREEPQP